MTILNAYIDASAQCPAHSKHSINLSAFILMSINFISITIILLRITMIFLSSRMVPSKKRRPGQFPGAAWSHLAPTYRPQNHSQMCVSRLHCHPSAKSRGLREAVAGNTCPTLPLPGGQSSVCPFRAHLMQRWFPGRCRAKKCQLYLPFLFPFPQICGTSLFSHHVTALCHSSPCIQTSQTI